MYLPENTISVHVFQRFGFPIILYARNEWEQTKIKYLESNYQKNQFNTLVIAKWSQNHHIPYKIFYPSVLSIITKPVVFHNFIYMKIRGF
jgi:hypothetical protein